MKLTRGWRFLSRKKPEGVTANDLATAALLAWCDHVEDLSSDEQRAALKLEIEDLKRALRDEYSVHLRADGSLRMRPVTGDEQ